jgi:hypothetical protein
MTHTIPRPLNKHDRAPKKTIDIRYGLWFNVRVGQSGRGGATISILNR